MSRIARIPARSRAAMIVIPAMLFGWFITGCDGQDSTGGGNPQLASHMSDVQRYTDKLGYALEARNGPLASFYLAQIDESMQIIITRFPDHEGKSVGSLAKTLTVPKINPLQQSIKSEKWNDADDRYTALIDSCNQCHASTFNQYIVVEPPVGDAPWSQQFEKQ